MPIKEPTRSMGRLFSCYIEADPIHNLSSITESLFLIRCIAYSFSMMLPRYQLKADESLTVFEFISVGKKGEIPKIIQYSETNLKDFYNLGFGDKNLQTGEIDDKVISDNGDSQKVLATVAATVYAFTDKYPEAWIYATGSTKSRTRLYRIGLTNNFDEIIEDFELYGQKEGEWQEFIKGVEYEAFLVRRKR